MLYVLCTTAGALIDTASTSSGLPKPPANSVIKALPEWDAVPDAPYVWVPAFKNWAVPPTVVPRMTRLEFASRFTLEEQVAIEMATEAHPTASTRATLRVLARNLDRATEVDVEDPRTVLGTETLVDVLVGAGVVDAQDRDARIAEILAPPA